MGEKPSTEMAIWDDMLALWKKLEDARPVERSEQARRYAVAITEYQKVLAYFHIFVMEGIDLAYYNPS